MTVVEEIMCINKDKLDSIFRKHRFWFMVSYCLFFVLLVFLTYVLDQSKKNIINLRKKGAERMTRSVLLCQEKIGGFSRIIFKNWADEINFFGQINKDPCRASILKFVKDNDMFLYYVVSDEKGIVVCASTPNSKGVNIEDRRYYQDVMAKKEMVMGQYQTSKITERPSINLAYPVLDKIGDIENILILAINLDWFDEKIRDIQFSAQSKVLIVDSDGMMLASYPDVGKEREGESTNIDSRLLSLVLSKDSGTVSGEEVDGSSNVYAFDTFRIGRENGASFYSIVTMSKKSVIETILKWASLSTKLALGSSGLVFVCHFVRLSKKKKQDSN